MSKFKPGDKCVIIKAGDKIWDWAEGLSVEVVGNLGKDRGFIRCKGSWDNYKTEKIIPEDELRAITKLERALL